MARSVYGDFCETAGDKALVCLGSNKSNPVSEMLIARAFNCDPFIPQDGLASAASRSCPIFLRYRDSDPQPPSCCGNRGEFRCMRVSSAKNEGAL